MERCRERDVLVLLLSSRTVTSPNHCEAMYRMPTVQARLVERCVHFLSAKSLDVAT